MSGYVAVLPCTLPSSLGGDLSGLPVVGGVDPRPGRGVRLARRRHLRLRAAAAALAGRVRPGHRPLGLLHLGDPLLLPLRSPELPIAIAVTTSLGDRCRAVGDQCAVLARACEAYADHVDEQRAAILDLLHDLVRDAVVIEGVGIVLGVVTGGATAAGATALNAARIAAAAPRLMRIVELLRSLAATCAAPVRLAATALREVRVELEVFRHARITIASAYKAERVARIERLRSLLNNPRLFDPEELRGLSEQTRALCDAGRTASRFDGEGIMYVDPVHKGRQIRIMDGYPPGTRPDPMTEGPYAVISQNGVKVKIPLEGNPAL